MFSIDKPDSVSLSTGRSFLSEYDRSYSLAAYPQCLWRAEGTLTAYLALHQLGFTMPRLLPVLRWALTPPFHPYRHHLTIGGMLSVALSVTRTLVCPGVTWQLPQSVRTFLEQKLAIV